MYSIEAVLIFIAVTFIAAYMMGHNKGFEIGKHSILTLLTKQELYDLAKRLNIPTGDED